MCVCVCVVSGVCTWSTFTWRGNVNAVGIFLPFRLGLEKGKESGGRSGAGTQPVQHFRTLRLFNWPIPLLFSVVPTYCFSSTPPASRFGSHSESQSNFNF